MGQEQSILEKKGYKIEAETEHGVVATKDNDKFLIQKLEISRDGTLISMIETLNGATHPHIVSTKNSFEDGNGKYFLVTEQCQGGSLAEKMGLNEPSEEYEALSWTVEICMALKFIHEMDLLHEAVTPTKIYFTEAGTLRLCEFGKKSPSSNNAGLNSSGSEEINYLAPELLTEGTYDVRSEIWSLGCIMHEAYTHKKAFSAESNIKLIPKIISGDYSSLPACSVEFHELLRQMLNKRRDERPTASEILEKPIMIRCLSRKCTTMTEHLQDQLMKLREVAESLERVHHGATIGSLAGGVVGAAGGITSIVGLILAPFTFGTSLIVTGVGIGVGVAGGVAAGASNITKMVNETSDRKAVRSIIKKFDEKITAMALWLQVICKGLERLSTSYVGDVGDVEGNEDSSSSQRLAGVATRLGRGLGGVAVLGRLLRVVNIGKIVAQTSRAVRVAEAATGVLSGLFLAVDIFFIAMDAKEIHNIKRSDAKGDTRSEIMKFVKSIRSAADELQEVLDVFKEITQTLPSVEDDCEFEKSMSVGKAADEIDAV